MSNNNNIYIAKYKMMYPDYFNNSDYVFGCNLNDSNNCENFIIYKLFPNTICSEDNKIDKYKKYIASHLKIVLIFNKFEPEKKSVFFSDNDIVEDAEFYITPIVPFYLGLNKCSTYIGKYLEWYDNGIIKFIGYLKKGKKESFCTNYNILGKYKSSGEFVNGLKHNKWLLFHKNGNVTECFYKNGIMDGNVIVWKSIKKTIKLKSFTLKNGKKNGQYIEYFDKNQSIPTIFDSHNLNVKTKGNFINDKKTGQWMEMIDCVDTDKYYIKCNYCNGVKKGFVSKYKLDGTLCEKQYIY